MGIRHLIAMRNHLLAFKETQYTKSQLRKKLGFNAQITDECIDYLVSEERSVEPLSNGKLMRYQWRT